VTCDDGSGEAAVDGDGLLLDGAGELGGREAGGELGLLHEVAVGGWRRTVHDGRGTGGVHGCQVGDRRGAG
jgi:hypothetical protein